MDYYQIFISPSKDKRFQYLILVDKGTFISGYFAKTEDEMIELVLNKSKLEQQLQLFEGV